MSEYNDTLIQIDPEVVRLDRLLDEQAKITKEFERALELAAKGYAGEIGDDAYWHDTYGYFLTKAREQLKEEDAKQAS